MIRVWVVVFTLLLCQAFLPINHYRWMIAVDIPLVFVLFGLIMDEQSRTRKMLDEAEKRSQELKKGTRSVP